jgi:type I restriction enzyme S subunit
MNPRKFKLSEIASLRTGKLDSNAAVANSEYPFFTCAQETYRIDKYAFDTEAVLLGGNNAEGIFPLKYYSGKFNAYQRTYVIESRDKSVLSTRYLYYALKPSLSYFRSASIGAATQYLTKGILDNFLIVVPSLQLQQRIVGYVSTYDNLIANNNRRIELLGNSARLLFEEWFVRLRYPGHEHEKIIDGVPQGWERGIVHNFYDTASGGTPSRGEPRFFEGSIPWVKTQELNNSYILETQEYITEQAVGASAAKVFPKGTVLVAMYGATIGETAILGVDAATNQACCALLPRDARASTEHAFVFLRVNQRGLVSLSQGAAQNNVSQAIIRQYPMLMPPLSLMKLFNDFAAPVLQQFQVLQKQVSQLTRARDLLLPRLMDGRIEV